MELPQLARLEPVKRLADSVQNKAKRQEEGRKRDVRFAIDA